MLQGYRVLDFTHWVAGPTCTRIMGELGADVIKVERSQGGDHVRPLGVVRDGMSSYYFQHNHSKRSLALDLSKPAAKQLILAMIPKIDVLVENFAPGVISALGFGYETIRKLNPRIVMASISVAGQTGPLSTKAGYDYLGAALAGVLDQMGEPDGTPIMPPMAIGDVSTGVAAAMAVGFALLHRERTGEGQYIESSLLDTYFHMHELAVPIVSLRPGRWTPKRSGALHQTASPCGVFKASGGFVFIVVQQHEIQRLWRAMAMPEMGSDPRFATNRERVRNKHALKEIIEQWLATFPDRDSAIARLDSERVPCASVYRLEEAMQHPHLRERHTVRRVSDPALGEFDIPGMPAKFSAWPEAQELKASRLGADNEAVLSEVLGLSHSEIENLYADGVLLRAAEPDAPGAAAGAAPGPRGR
jgi:CoA:oxalate CoA-transferase